MARIGVFFLVVFVQLVTAQRQRSYKAKFSDCGSLLKIAPALQGSVTITAPYNSKTGRHILGKVNSFFISNHYDVQILKVAGAFTLDFSWSSIFLEGEVFTYSLHLPC